MQGKSIFSGDTRVSTEDVPVRHRVNYWQDYVSNSLIGIECTASDIKGLDVTLSHTDFGKIAVAEIVGNRHVVERNMKRIRLFQKDSVFVCLQLHGATHLLQGGDCLALEAGDVFFYKTSSPYVHGNTTDTHTLILDIPSDMFFMNCNATSLKRPLKISGRLGLGRLALSSLQKIEARVRSNDSSLIRQHAGNQLLDLASSLLNAQDGSRGLLRSAMYNLLQAKSFIENHLDSSKLNTELVARSVGLSARQLNRIFMREDTSVSRFIWNRRLERAREDLQDPALRQIQIAEIAFRWGFASAAHFSRAYRQRYGLPPTAYRALS